jgi:hypothetical protein
MRERLQFILIVAALLGYMTPVSAQNEAQRTGIATGAAMMERPALEPPRGDAGGMVWQAPVGHRQPRPVDIPAVRPKPGEFDVELERLDRALDGRLQICRAC